MIDTSLRHGLKKDERSRPIENDKWRAFDAALADVRATFADMPPDELQAIIDEATTALRGRKP